MKSSFASNFRKFKMPLDGAIAEGDCSAPGTFCKHLPKCSTTSYGVLQLAFSTD